MQGLLSSKLECFCDKLVGISMHIGTGLSVSLISMGKHQVSQPQAENGAFLGDIESIMECLCGTKSISR